MITVTMKQIFESKEALGNLGSIRLPLKQSYQVAKMIMLINEEMNIISKVRDSILQHHQDKTEEERIELLNQEIKTILEDKLTLNCEKVNLSECVIELTPIEVIQLDSFCIFIKDD